MCNTIMLRRCAPARQAAVVIQGNNLLSHGLAGHRSKAKGVPFACYFLLYLPRGAFFSEGLKYLFIYITPPPLAAAAIRQRGVSRNLLERNGHFGVCSVVLRHFHFFDGPMAHPSSVSPSVCRPSVGVGVSGTIGEKARIARGVKSHLGGAAGRGDRRSWSD